MVSITVQLNFDYALSFRFFLLWQPLVETGARSQLTQNSEKRRFDYSDSSSAVQKFGIPYTNLGAIAAQSPVNEGR